MNMIVAIHILPFLFISFALNHPKFPVLSMSRAQLKVAGGG
jgi:ABC-type Na+ efflux pump permease subunit